MSPETVWKLYTLAEEMHRQPPPPAFAAPGICTGRSGAFTKGSLKQDGVLLMPKLEFSTFRYLLFVVENELTVSQEVSREKGEVIFPFLSFFDRDKLSCNTHVTCGLFPSQNITLRPSLQRRTYPWRLINHYP